jgi:hypothetical protein
MITGEQMTENKHNMCSRKGLNVVTFVDLSRVTIDTRRRFHMAVEQNIHMDHVLEETLQSTIFRAQI